MVVTTLEIAMKATVDCPWCGAGLSLGKSISGDRITMHGQPWCERFGSMFFTDSGGLKSFLDGMYAKMEEGNA